MCGSAVGCVAGMEISALYLLTTEMARVGGAIKEISPVGVVVEIFPSGQKPNHATSCQFASVPEGTPVQEFVYR